MFAISGKIAEVQKVTENLILCFCNKNREARNKKGGGGT
jgi:hypothetical protein